MVLGLSKERGDMYKITLTLNKDFVWEVFFLCAARHPVDFDGVCCEAPFDGRPTAGAQVLATVSMVPWFRATQGQHCTAECRSRSVSTRYPKAQGIFVVVEMRLV